MRTKRAEHIWGMKADFGEQWLKSQQYIIIHKWLDMLPRSQIRWKC